MKQFGDFQILGDKYMVKKYWYEKFVWATDVEKGMESFIIVLAS